MIYFMKFNNYNLKDLFNSNDIIMSKLEVKAENHKIFIFKKIFEFCQMFTSVQFSRSVVSDSATL